MKTIIEKSKVGVGINLNFDKPYKNKTEILPKELLREKLELPEVAESEVVRHFHALSKMNYCIDDGFYPLGSCTMKYNPRVNEKLAANSNFNIHPLNNIDNSQGCLKIIFELQESLNEILGMKGTTLQPCAGAHGELTGLMLIKAYVKNKNEKRNIILIPDSAHGTNPASVSLCGFESQTVKSGADGLVDLNDLKSKLNDNIAGIMLTVPNTLGIFERDIIQITGLVHDAGGLCYMDGANMNALVGILKPGNIGIDVMHLNLHKTFSTPHGGGGPGAGAVGVNEKLVDFLPIPEVIKTNDNYSLNYNKPKSIGKVSTFYGNFGVLVRALAYIKTLGKDGFKEVAQNAVLNANYVFKKLSKHFHVPFDKICMHEFVITDKNMPNHVTTNDIAKRLLDYNFHPPTVYFPLIVSGIMMIEPTETETKETLDAFCETMIKICKEAQETPELVLNAPQNTPVKRLDAVTAARKPILNWQMDK